MSEAAPAKAKTRFWSQLALVATLAIVGYVGFRWATAESVYVAKADVLVTKRLAAATGPKDSREAPWIDDFFSTYTVVVKSPHLLVRAIDRRGLKKLKSLENESDPLTALQKMLHVRRSVDDAGRPNSVMTIECRGPIADDCEKIVDAVVESFQDVLERIHGIPTESTVQFFRAARDSLFADLKDAEKKYADFRGQRAAALAKMNSTEHFSDEIRSIDRKIFDNRVRQEDLNSQIDQIQTGRDTIPVELMVREWAKTSGFDALPDEKRKGITAATAYLETLRAKLALVQSQERSLVRLKETQIDSLKDLLSFTFEDDKLRNEVARMQKLFDSTIQKLTESDLARDKNGFEVRLLSPTKVEKARW